MQRQREQSFLPLLLARAEGVRAEARGGALVRGDASGGAGAARWSPQEPCTSRLKVTARATARATHLDGGEHDRVRADRDDGDVYAAGDAESTGHELPVGRAAIELQGRGESGE